MATRHLYWILTGPSFAVHTLLRNNAKNFKQIFPENDLRGHSPNFNIYVAVSNFYIPTMDLPILPQEICGPILGIYRLLTHRHMNVEIRTEDVQFPEKEYINGIFFAVYSTDKMYLLLTVSIHGCSQGGVTKRCRQSWLTNSALVYEPKCERRGGVAGSPPLSTAVHRSPNKLTPYLAYGSSCLWLCQSLFLSCPSFLVSVSLSVSLYSV